MLSLQPSRIQLGYDAAMRPITISREWFRYITDSFERMGGTEAPSNRQLMMPVGSLMFMTVATNPADLFGYGTWVRFGQGRVLVGLDETQSEFNSIGETGGAKTHTLTSDEMPSHTHLQDAHTHTQQPHTHAITDPGHTHADGSAAGTAAAGVDAVAVSGTTGSATTGITVSNATATNDATTATNQSTGGGQAHNNLQPYVVVVIWQRTA